MEPFMYFGSIFLLTSSSIIFYYAYVALKKEGLQKKELLKKIKIIDANGIESEKKISLLKKELQEMTGSLEGINHLWNKTIKENIDLKKDLLIAEKQMHFMAKKILESNAKNTLPPFVDTDIENQPYRAKISGDEAPQMPV